MDISHWREKIDEIDEQLIVLLNERARCAVEIGHVKRKADMQIYDPQREYEILEHIVKVSEGPLTDAAVRRLFERIIDESRRLERERAEERVRRDAAG